jgi:hypothetical protein
LTFGFKVHNEDDDISCCNYVIWAMHELGLIDICARYFELIGFSLMPFPLTCVVSLRFLVSTFNTISNMMLKETLVLNLNVQQKC